MSRKILEFFKGRRHGRKPPTPASRNVTVAMSGVVAATALGVLSWTVPLTGVEAIGETDDLSVTVTGGGDTLTIELNSLQATGEVGSVTVLGSSLTGVSSTSSVGTIGVGIVPQVTVGITGVASPTALGTLARLDRQLTGVNTSIGVGTMGVSATGGGGNNVTVRFRKKQSLRSVTAVGSLGKSRTVALSSVTGTGSVGTVSTSAGSGLSIPLTGVSTATAPGSLAGTRSKAVTGLASASGVGSVGTVTAGGDVTLPITGPSATTLAVGTLRPAPTKALTGLSATLAVGTLPPPSTRALSGLSTVTGIGSLADSRTLVLSGNAATGSAGLVTYSATTNPTVALTTVLATGSVGSLGHPRAKALTTNLITTSVGSLGHPRSKALTGVQIFGSAGGFPPLGQDFGGYRPQYQGYGTTTAAGRGGTLYRINTTADNSNSPTPVGDGSFRCSLRYAAEIATEPRCIVFERSGNFTLGSDIIVRAPFCTIAGQTAPSPGVTVKGFGIQLYTHDVVQQHVRIRPGDGPPLLPQTEDHDASIGYNGAGVGAYNLVNDHCSFSWAQGKNNEFISMSANAGLTYWRCISSEALYRAQNVIVSPGQPSSLAMLLGNGDTNLFVSVIGSLFAHNSDRNPEPHDNVRLHFINNIVYDWGRDENAYQWASFFYGVGGFGPWFADLIGNSYIVGPSPHPFLPLYAVGTWAGEAGSQLYLSDNLVSGATDYINYMSFDPRVGTPPVPLTNITVRSSSTLNSYVLGGAGARPLDRDAVDQRIVADVINGTGTVISSQDDVGGWPSLAVNTQVFADPANPNAVASGQAFRTNREMSLEQLAQALEV